MSKRTPGPWKHDAPTSFVVDSQDRIIANIGGHADEIAHEMSANARLIAAAPEMLEALERIEGLLLQSTGMAGIEIHSIVRRARSIASDAIAKARGESDGLDGVRAKLQTVWGEA